MEESRAYLEGTMEGYLLGTIERQEHPTKVDMALCFIGSQGTGKTETCRFLGRDWYRASTQDVHNTKQFMESVTGASVVEFREGLQLMNNETLKDFLDSERVQFRKAYDRREKPYPIPFVTIMTTNDPNPLTDLTGARRIMPMYLPKNAPGSVKPWELTEEDWYSVWVRARRDYLDGKRWRDSVEEIKPLAERVQEYASRTPPHYEEMKEVLYRYDVGNRIAIKILKDDLRGRLSESGVNEALDGLRKNPSIYGLRSFEGTFGLPGDLNPKARYRGYVKEREI